MKSTVRRIFQIQYSRDGKRCLKTCPQLTPGIGCRMLDLGFGSDAQGNLWLARPAECCKLEAAWKRQAKKEPA